MKKDARNTIVILTDVRFWHRGTGAQQRIYVMVRYLMDCGFDVVTLLATTTADPRTDSTLAGERQRIRELGLDIQSLFEDWRPEGWFAGVIWEIKCIVNWLRGGTRKRPPKPPSPRYLKGFELPVLTPRFQQMLRQINPDAVIVEYVTLAWLIDQSARSGNRQLLVDTHDLLSERDRQFREFGHEHWIRISSEEEANALSQFDTVIAIQPHEAATFRQMVPDSV
ncbi:MAG: glycosyltransferase, partial [Pirellulaceae bacterium]